MELQKEHENTPNRTKPSAIIAITIICIGVILLLHNFHILPVIPWSKIIPYWPLILVLFGVEFIIGRALILRLIVITVLSLAILCGIILTIPSRINVPASFSGLFERSVIYIQSMQARDMTKIITIDPSMYQDTTIISRTVTVEAGAGSYELMDDQIPQFLSLHATYSNEFAEPILSHTASDSALSIRFHLKESAGHVLNTSGNQLYRLTIGQDTIPTDIRIAVGIGKANILLDTTPITSIHTTVGAGSASMKLSGDSIPGGTIELSVGVGTLMVSLPKEQPVVVNYDIGLGSMTINNRKVNGEGIYTSPIPHNKKPMNILAHVGLGTCIIKQE